jgi:hypothetical protein
MATNGPIEELSYEDMLSALLGLLGQKVTVFVDLQMKDKSRPLATFWGVLTKARDNDVSTIEGWAHLSGETMSFYVDQSAAFFIRQDDFDRGQRQNGYLTSFFGDGRITVAPRET